MLYYLPYFSYLVALIYDTPHAPLVYVLPKIFLKSDFNFYPCFTAFIMVYLWNIKLSVVSLIGIYLISILLKVILYTFIHFSFIAKFNFFITKLL